MIYDINTNLRVSVINILYTDASLEALDLRPDLVCHPISTE